MSFILIAKFSVTPLNFVPSPTPESCRPGQNWHLESGEGPEWEDSPRQFQVRRSQAPVEPRSGGVWGKELSRGSRVQAGKGDGALWAPADGEIQPCANPSR